MIADFKALIYGTGIESLEWDHHRSMGITNIGFYQNNFIN